MTVPSGLEPSTTCLVRGPGRREGQLPCRPMTGELEPTEQADIVVPGALDAQSVRAGWLLSFKSTHTRRAYAGDLARWLKFCSDRGVDPLAARRGHVDAWARSLEADGSSQPTVARRLSSIASWYTYAT